MASKSVVIEGANAKYEQNNSSSQMERNGLKMTTTGKRRQKIRRQKHMQWQPRIEDLQENNSGKQNENGNKGGTKPVLSCEWNDDQKQ